MKAIIDKTAAYEFLERKHTNNILETKEVEKANETLSTLAKAELIENQTGKSIANVLNIASSLNEAVSKYSEFVNSEYYKNILRVFYPGSEDKDF